MESYRLEGQTFVIDDYDRKPAFSSFLPGLAGVKGIPLWTFYTNRGQGMNSFGIDNKGNAIMEFNSANTAFENTQVKGFRTFLKIDGEYYEPFFTYEKEAKRQMRMNKNSFKIIETNEKYGIEVTVNYYVLPNESIGALVRQVSVKNIGVSAKEVQVIDGLPKTASLKKCQTYLRVGQILEILKTRFHIIHLEHQQRIQQKYLMLRADITI